MADWLDEIEDEQADELLLDDDESGVVITSPEIQPGLYEHFKVAADKGQSLLRVDKFLVARIEGTTRNRIQ